MKTIVKIEMHPQNSCPLFSYPYACLHLSSTVFWNQNNPWFSYPYAISVLYSSTPMLSRGTRLGVQRYENIVDDGTHLLIFPKLGEKLFDCFLIMFPKSKLKGEVWPGIPKGDLSISSKHILIWILICY